MRIFISLLTITLWTILWTVAAEGRMYRWVDENGVTVYSQSPPPGGESATQIKPPPPPSTSEEEAWEKVNKQWQKSSDFKEDRQKEAEQKAKEKEANQLKKKNCAAARRNLEVYQNSPRAMVQTPDGKYHRNTEEERQKKIKEAQEQVKKYCS